MEYRQYGHAYVIRIDKGEELFETLLNFVRKHDVKLCQVSGIGAASEVTIGLFEPDEKKYYSQTLHGPFEIVSLSGTVTVMNGEKYIHLHIVVSDAGYHAFGGHLNKAVISGTCEVVLNLIDGEVGREYNDEVGLNLLKM